VLGRQEVVAMMHWEGHHDGGWAVGMVLMMILFWGSITALVWVGVRLLIARPPESGSHRQEPREILAERLARGEIEPDEFERRLELLGGPR
jgi:putative membrane protein